MQVTSADVCSTALGTRRPAACQSLTIIHDEVCQAYSVGVGALECGCIQVHKGRCCGIQGDLCYARTLSTYCALEPGLYWCSIDAGGIVSVVSVLLRL